MRRQWWSEDHHRRLGLRLLHDLALAASVVHLGNVLSVLASPGWTGFFTAELVSGVTTAVVLVVMRFTRERWHPRLFALLVTMVCLRWCLSWAVGDPELVYTSTVAGVLYLPFLVPIALLLGVRFRSLIATGVVLAGMALVATFRGDLLGTPFDDWRIGPAVVCATALLAVYSQRWMRHLDALRSSESREQQLSLELQAATARQLATRMETVTQIGGALAHELNNILAVVQPLSAGLVDQLDGELRADARDILRSSERLRGLGQQLRMLTRQHGPPRDPTDLVAVVGEQVEKLSLETARKGMSVALELTGAPAWVAASSEELATLVRELVANAVDASPQGGSLTIRVETEALPHGESSHGREELAVLSVEDRGHGIDAGLRDTAFHPFVSTRAEPGRGLGLTTALAVVLRAGGGLVVENRVGGGVRACARLPLVLGSEQPAELVTASVPVPEIPVSPQPPRPLRVLLVDDEPMVLRSTSRVLTRAGMEVFALASSVDALDELVRRPAHYDLVLSDVRMPMMSGPQLAEAAGERLSQVPPFLFITGYVDPAAVDRMSGSNDGMKVLQKPFSRTDLLERIAQVTAKPSTEERART